MITELIVHTGTDIPISITRQSGFQIQTVSDSTTAMTMDYQSLTNTVTFGTDGNLPQSGNTYIEMLEQHVDGVYTINGISPTANNNFYILGSGCTSVQSSQASLQIFDGCVPCPTCQILAQLQQDLQDAVIWANGMKDCNLYYQPASQRLWNQMLQKRIKQNDSCKITTQLERPGKAIALLHQYKAAVAMWNYLVASGSSVTEIIQAAQDYGGFVVQTKRRWNYCGTDSDSVVTLDIKATLQDGQTPTQLLSGQVPWCIAAYAGQVETNTYMEYGTDKGPNGGRISSSGITFSSDVEQSSDSQPVFTVSARFVFQMSQLSDTVFSAAVKVLPVVFGQGSDSGSGETPQAGSKLGLDQWARLRTLSTSILEQEQTLTNNWRISINWNGGSAQKRDNQTYYYLTGYSKHPPIPESDSSGSEIPE